MIKITLLSLCLLLSPHALSESWVHFGGWSKHFKDKGQNEDHNVAGYDNGKYIALTFKNSYNKRGAFVGRIKRGIKCIDRMCFDLAYGALYGYEILNKKISPAVLPIVSYNRNEFAIDATYIPGKVFALKFRFKL